jgi:hypothetical protein
MILPSEPLWSPAITLTVSPVFIFSFPMFS